MMPTPEVEERRRVSLNKEDVKEVITEAFEAHMRSDSHQYLEALLLQKKNRAEMWEKVKTDVTSHGVIAVIGFIAIVLWTDVVTWLKHLLGTH
jgi:hypothetical protein